MGTGWSQDKGSEHYEEQGAVQKAQNKDGEGEETILIKRSELPYNQDQIMQDADQPIDIAANGGVFLKQKKMKYWVDDNSMNCFMFYASSLSITWGENTTYWNWPIIKESSNVSVVAAQLINVCWLEIHGRFNTVNLTPRTLYEVLFVVLLKDPAYGWEIPVNLRLILADGTRKERKENMMEKVRERWIEIPVGEFIASPKNTGEMEISLYEYAGIWKKGLVIKGVVIRPKR